MDTFSYLAALVTALLALLGAIIGAWFTRRSEYEKWFRQEKAAALAEYLRQLHDTRTKARDAYYSSEGDEHSRSIKATEEFANLDKYTALARLFMSAAGRETLTEHQKRLWINCTSRGGPANNTIEIQTLMEKIQQLVEAELEKIPKRLS